MQERWRNVRDRWLTVNAREPEQGQRGQLLSILLAGLCVLTLPLTAINGIRAAVAPSPDQAFYVVIDVCSMLVLVGLWRWNRTGHTQWASYTFLVIVVLGCSALFTMRDLDRSLIVYAIPIVAASFLIGPGSSFVFALLSALGYSLAWLANGGASTYNYVSVLALFIMALLAWLIAARLEKDSLERKRAEQALRASEARERERADELQTIMDAVPALVWVAHDPEGCMITGNRACYEFLCAPSGTNLSKTAPDVEPLSTYGFYKDGVRLPRHELPLQMSARGTIVRDYEDDVVFDDGATRHLVGNASPLRDAQGHLRGAVSAFIDITDRKRAEKELERTLAELERSNAELQQFAYVASHDLQEPLRMVTSYLQLLAKRYQGRLDSDADEFIGYAVDGAQRMQRLIADLLAYSRVGTRGKPLAPTDCQAALDQALANLEIAIEEAGATVTHDPLPTVLADEGQLVQVFQNLIGNGCKFHGAEPPRVHISARETFEVLRSTPERSGVGETSRVSSKVWEFSVRDNGIGIDPQQFERIFMVFQRLHTRAECPGSGIGLAICKKIVERHGGRIRVESQPGRGSTFYFTLPAKEL